MYKGSYVIGFRFVYILHLYMLSVESKFRIVINFTKQFRPRFVRVFSSFGLFIVHPQIDHFALLQTFQNVQKWQHLSSFDHSLRFFYIKIHAYMQKKTLVFTRMLTV